MDMHGMGYITILSKLDNYCNNNFSYYNVHDISLLEQRVSQ